MSTEYYIYTNPDGTLHKIRKNTYVRKKKGYDKDDMKEAKKLIAQGMSKKSICAKYKISYATLYRYIDKYNLEKSDSSESSD